MHSAIREIVLKPVAKEGHGALVIMSFVYREVTFKQYLIVELFTLKLG